MSIGGINPNTMATYALMNASTSVEAVEQAESAGLLNTKNEIADNQRQQLNLNDELTTVGKTARKKKKFLRFGKNRKIRKAKEKEVKLETNLKKTKGHHDRLLNKADAVLDRIERGNEMGQRLQQILQQFQKPPVEGGE